MADRHAHHIQVPPEVRALAEDSVLKARRAFDGYISAAHKAFSALEGQVETARKGAKDVTEKAMTFAERNIANSFDFAQQLMRAKDVHEVLKLQSDYVKAQMQALAEQAKELRDRISRAQGEAAGPNTNTALIAEQRTDLSHCQVADLTAEELAKLAREAWKNAGREALAQGLAVSGSHNGRRFRYHADGRIEDLGPISSLPNDIGNSR